MKTRVRDLKADALDVHPLEWPEGGENYYEYYSGLVCDCGTVIIMDETCMGCGAKHSRPHAPLRESFYALPNFPFGTIGDELAMLGEEDLARKVSKIVKEAATILVRESDGVCLVHLLTQDEWGLAITCKSTDAWWAIADGYVLLGYLPPLRVVEELFRLPEASNDKARRVLPAARASARVTIQRARHALEQLKLLRRHLQRPHPP